jgi:hypothetical protein
MKKEKQQYTTIQISREISKHIRNFCKEQGVIASKMTENYWSNLISSSMSGSIVL